MTLKEPTGQKSTAYTTPNYEAFGLFTKLILVHEKSYKINYNKNMKLR